MRFYGSDMTIFSGSIIVFSTLCFLLMPIYVGAAPVDCYALKQLYPRCGCEAALDENNQETFDAVVDCSGLSLNQVPAPQPNTNVTFDKEIYELKFNNNNISSLEDTTFSGVRIRKLDLSGNAISRVANNTFLGVDLKILVMDGDLSSPPPANAFTNLHTIEELVLRNYKVQDLGVGGQHIFQSLTALKQLTLDNWGIKSIEPDAFIGPMSLDILILTNQDLTGVPLDALMEQNLRSLKKLEISYSKIQTITQYVFQLLNVIEELDLNNNQIIELKNDCFNGIGDTLLKLRLAHNVLSSEAAKLAGLKALTKITELDLSHNVMTTVPSLSQLGSVGPLKLYLNNNEIASLPENAFEGVASSLHTLDLSENKISTIDSNSLNGVTSLVALIITYQTIGPSDVLVVPTSLAQAAGTLRHLNLSGQKVEPNVLWATVKQLQNLEGLNLGYTRLQTIPELQLVNLTMLQELDLSGNELREITQQTLVGPQDTLKYLYLSDNSISEIPTCVFYGYSSFPITISLHSNPLSCDCSISWLWERIKNNTITFPVGQEPKCTNHNNQLLASLTQATFCSGPITDIPCIEYTTPPAPTTTPPTTPQAVTLTISLGQIQNTSIVISWSLSDSTNLRYFKVDVTNQFSESEFSRQINNANTRMVKATGLLPNTHHNLCVTAVFTDKNAILECGSTRTLGGPTTAPQKDSGSEEVGIIVGAVVGAVVVIGILIAIFILLFIRKRPNKSDKQLPSQPRNYSKSELPSMSGDTRVFAKPKKRSSSTADGSGGRDSMQVVAISDGQPKVGRALMLNSDGSYKTMEDKRSASQTTYENDHGPLPSPPSYKPTTQPTSYYNEAFTNDKYDEIDGQREIIL